MFEGNMTGVCTVPESKGTPLAETTQDIVRMAREFRYFSWKTWKKESSEETAGGNAAPISEGE